MNPKAVVLLAEGFEEVEAITAIDLLRRAGIEVTIASLGDKNVSGAHGISVIADIELEEIESDFDACILPGGMPGATHLADSERVLSLIQILHKEQKLIAAICASPAIVLTQTGILKNKSATCYPGMEQHFAQETRFLNQPVVEDGNIITSRGVGTALEFSLAVINKLCGAETAEQLSRATLVT